MADCKALLLTFAYTDLRGLDAETELVYETFRSKGYAPEKFTLQMESPWNGEKGLRLKLESFLSGTGGIRIIYYHGHGGFSFLEGMKFIR